MRSKYTNILQISVILMGLFYIIFGFLFFYSPIKFVSLFGVEVAGDFLNIAIYDSFLLPLYYIARTFALMVGICGIASILPLFDPLKYRGIIYYIYLIFPAISSIFLISEGIKYENLLLKIIGIVFAILSVLVLFGLIITMKKALHNEE